MLGLYFLSMDEIKLKQQFWLQESPDVKGEIPQMIFKLFLIASYVGILYWMDKTL